MYLMSIEEQIIIVNRQNEEIGIVPRSIMRQQHLLHRASYVIIFNNKQEILIQKRSDSKDLYPGFFDPTTGGVLKAGETYEQNAVRELSEELGIERVDLNELGDLFFENEKISVWGRVFWVKYDGEIRFNDGEVVKVCFVDFSGIKSWLKGRNIMPDGRYIIERFLESIPIL